MFMDEFFLLQVENDKINYQASSPDEIALVSWTESVGLTLMDRDTTSMTLRNPHGVLMKFSVLQVIHSKMTLPSSVFFQSRNFSHVRFSLSHPKVSAWASSSGMINREKLFFT